MNPFPDKLFLENAGMRGDSRQFRLTSGFRFLSSRGLITVPAGFVTDGASIPRAFWNILQPFGPYFEAAIVHDFLYSRRAKPAFCRAVCDELFKEAMYNTGLDWLRRETIYRAVRWFGGNAFRKPDTANP